MEEQVRKFKKRNREDSGDGNSEQDHQHKERATKKERRDEALDKTTQLKYSTDQRFHNEEKKKNSSNGRGEEVLEGGDVDREIVKAEKKKKKKKKNKKKKKEEEEEKSSGDLEEGSLHKVMVEEQEEDQISREEEKIEKKRRKKEKKRKMKEEVVEESRHSQKTNDTLLNGVGTMGSDGLDSDNPNGEPTEKETNNMKKKEKKRKKVTFEDKVVAVDQEQARDVLNEADHFGNESSKDDVEEIWGVRFTREEDEILKDAVWTYIKSKGWDEHVGLDKVFNCKKHKDARDCWAEIKMSLPHRPRQAVRFRARLLLEAGGRLGKWSKEEEDLLTRLQSERGHKWREFSIILNRQRSCIKEKWRSLKRSVALKEKGILKRSDTLKEKAGWSQDELQQLSKMVHESLRLNRLLATKKEKLDRHILRDNIGWEKIANTLGTHNHGPCCSKWYYNLQSSLVADGHWANQDDFLLLESLLESGASAEEEVEWDNLLEDRSGQVCLTRWKQMVKHLGENRTRQFLDKLDVLAHRYAPELLEISAEDNTTKELPSVTAQAS